MKKPIKRTLVFRECPICKSGAFVRKDAIGILCRSCRAKENHKTKKPIDTVGFRSGRIVAIKISHKLNRQFFWECLCDCGKSFITSGHRIRSGKTKSCGCINATQKGLSSTKIHTRWRAMIARCHNPRSIGFKNYGGRGIIVCDRWRNSFDEFVKDMGPIPEGMTLDRINSDMDYEPSNCRWASVKAQNNNRTNNYMITAFGETMTLTQWADKIGLRWGTLRQRIERNGWKIEDALTIKVAKKKK